MEKLLLFLDCVLMFISLSKYVGLSNWCIASHSKNRITQRLLPRCYGYKKKATPLLTVLVGSGKAHTEQTMKDQRESRCITQLFL